MSDQPDLQAIKARLAAGRKTGVYGHDEPFTLVDCPHAHTNEKRADNGHA